jgi:hemerythrin-like metal-binding protein
MQGILWNERFSVGVPAMDEQHKRLIDLLNTLRASEDIGIAFDTIMGMFDYASVHFRAEEDLLRQAGYSELETQEREHLAFLSKAVEFSKKDLSDARVCGEMITYLRNWLLQHILNEDMKYKRCVPDRLRK